MWELNLRCGICVIVAKEGGREGCGLVDEGGEKEGEGGGMKLRGRCDDSWRDEGGEKEGEEGGMKL